jgi:hypothetical protein
VHSTRVQLSIDVDSDPITGSLGEGDAEPRGFCGWIELAEAIEHVRHPEVATTPSQSLGGAESKP